MRCHVCTPRAMFAVYHVSKCATFARMCAVRGSAIHDCALGISPVITSCSGVKGSCAVRVLQPIEGMRRDMPLPSAWYVLIGVVQCNLLQERKDRGNMRHQTFIFQLFNQPVG